MKKCIILTAFLSAAVWTADGQDVSSLNEKQISKIITSTSKNVSSWTRLDFDEALEYWDPPFNFTKLFPYYLAGHDSDGRPIWIAELGRWNVRQNIVEKGPEYIKEFEKYVRQSGFRAFKSIENSTSPEFPGGEGSVILDFDGLDVSQLYSIGTLSLFLRMGLEYRFLLTEHLSTIYVINANYVATTIIRLARPVFGVFLERFQVFGTRKELWIPELLQRFPRSQLPPWYGGSKNFKPEVVYGR